MDDDHREKERAPRRNANQRRAITDPREMRQQVSARLIHLDDCARSAVEKAVRILRPYFVDHQERAPRFGKLEGLMLVGGLADVRNSVSDDE